MTETLYDYLGFGPILDCSNDDRRYNFKFWTVTKRMTSGNDDKLLGIDRENLFFHIPVTS